MTAFLNFKLRPNGATSEGKVYTYRSGTYIPKDTYPTKEDATNETNANSNPVILSTRGEADIFVKGPTKVVLKDANDNLLWTADNFDSVNDNIVDANGNEFIVFNSVVNAINNLHMTNAATTSSPILSGVGTESNVGVAVKAKGTGKLMFPTGNLSVTSGDFTLTAGDLDVLEGDLILSSDVTIGSGNVTITDESSTFSPVPVGLVTWNASAEVPSGWLECDGAAISRSTYSSLFSTIGTTYGSGNGTTTFNLPNQARRVLVGKGGSGTATLGNVIGSTGGAETHTLSIAELPAHTHDYSYKDRTAPLTQVGPTVSNSVHPRNTAEVTSSTGGDTAHNIMQPSLVSMLIIRAF